MSDNSFIMPNYNVLVEGEFIPIDSYNIKYNLTNIQVEGELLASHEKDYTAILKANMGYELPTNIKIKIGEVEVNNYYTYNKDKGNIIIPSNIITNDIEIIAIANKLPINPQTSDNIISILILTILSLIGGIISLIYLKQKKI